MLAVSDRIDLKNEEGFSYFAFISYKSEDVAYARHLKRDLQAYRLPAKTHRKHPDLSKRCTPVFLDKTDLTPGLLDEGLRSEVQSAKFIILICSRHAHDNSTYLDHELQFFLDGGGDATRVIPFIVDPSSDVVNECFPKRLAELCREKNIVGANIHDDGWRTAVIKVIAAMLGIRREELESADATRRRRNSIIAALLSAAILAGGFFSWNYFRTREIYYLDYAEVYGVPTGIRQLKKSEVNTIPAHYTIVSSRGKVRELRYENAYGRPAEHRNYDNFDRVSTMLYSYSDDGQLDRVTRQNAYGGTVQVLDYDGINVIDLKSYTGDAEEGFLVSSTSRLSARTTQIPLSGLEEAAAKSNVVRYLVYYDEHGYMRELHYASNGSNDVGADADGISGLRYARDELGRTERVYYLAYKGSSGKALRTEDYQAMTKKNGIAGIAYRYNESDDLEEISFLGEMENPVLCEQKFSSHISRYDGHCEIEEIYFGTDRQKSLNSNGVASISREFNEKGNPVRTCCFGVDGQAVSNSLGYSIAAYEYENGFCVKTVFCDENGSPVMIQGGFAGYESEYDTLGTEIRRTFLGTDGKPVLCEEGYASVASYDTDRCIRLVCYGTDGEPIISKSGYAAAEGEYSDGFLIRVSYYDKEGHLTVGKEGYAERRSRYEDGNEASRSYYGSSGELCLCREGYAGFESEFNSRGEQTRIRYYGTDGEPILNQYGYAVKENRYDDRGNPIECRYYDTSEKLTIITYGYAITKHEYDDRGNETAISFFDAEEEPILQMEGIARRESDYDERGNETERRFYGADGNLILANGECAGWSSEYDEHGNEVRTAFFGLNREPVLCGIGYAGWEKKYDDRGNCTETIYLGMHGQPTVTSDWYTTERTEYDERGRQIQISYYDRDGAPVVSRAGYAKATAAYDKRGNPTRRSYFDVHDEPVVIPDGFAAYESWYDEKGNEVSVCFFGADGRPTLCREGYASIRMEYDERGNMIRQRYFGVDGDPIQTVEGYAEAVKDYDERGNRIMIQFFGTDGTRTLCNDGYFEADSEYDEYGNGIKTVFFGTDGEKTLCADGYAYWEEQFNERGDWLRLAYYGTANESVPGPEGYAEAVRTFDRNGRLVSRQYYDADGQPMFPSESESRRACILACSAELGDQAKSLPLEDYILIVRLGEWDYLQYEDDEETMFRDFERAMSLTVDEPTEFRYLEYSAEIEAYELFRDEFRAGEMGLRIMDGTIPETRYREIKTLLSRIQNPEEKPISMKNAA